MKINNLYQLFVLLFLLLLTISCQNNFYNYKKDLDLWRFPLIEPYELISPTKDSWFIKLANFNPYPFESNRPYQLSYIDSVGIFDHLIFIHSKHANVPNGSRPIWLVIDTFKKDASKYSIYEEQDFYFELEKMNLQNKIIVHSLDKVVGEFQDRLKLPKQWPPN